MSGGPTHLPGSSPRAAYQAAIARYTAELLPQARRSRLLSRLRLATFLPALALAILAFSRGPLAPLLLAAGVLLAGFAVLVVMHARVDDRIAWLEALRLVNERGIARLDRDWDRLPPADPPAGVIVEGHPYAADLDLFGRASLFQWLGPAATAMGSRQLAGWLLAGATGDEVRARQEAVSALAPLGAWREELAAHGIAASQARAADVERFVAWAEGPPFLGPNGRLLQIAVLLLTAAIWILLALFAAGVTDVALWLIPAVTGIVLSFGLAVTVGGWLDRAGAGQRSLERYGALLAHAVHAPRTVPRLDALYHRLTADGREAPAGMRRLHRILGFGELRHSAGILHFPIQALTLWDFHVVFALERWRVRVGPPRRGLDRSARRARRDVRRWLGRPPTTRLDEAGARSAAPVIDAVALGHPLLADARRVTNDVRVGPAGTLLLVTGSNMSGRARSCAPSASTSSSPRPARRRAPGGCRCRRATCRPASACRTRSSSGCRISWRRSRVSRGSSTRREHERAPAACCCTCSTRCCRARTASNARSRCAPSPATCSTPARSA